MVTRPNAPMNSGFVRHAGMLSAGKIVAAAVSILGAPILGRLFAPRDYAVFAAFMSIALVLASIGNWQYNTAIVIEPSRRKVFALVRLCLLTSVLTAIFASAVAISVSVVRFKSADMETASRWLLMLPAAILAGGVALAWGSLANRLRAYRLIAVTDASCTPLTLLFSVAFGLAGWVGSGLILSYPTIYVVYAYSICQGLMSVFYIFRSHHLASDKFTP